MSQPVEFSPELAKLEREVERWRRVRKLPCPIPGDFWDRAVVLAGELGVGKVARALRLNQTTLKERVENAGKPDPCLATFVELLPAALSATTPTSSSQFLGECAFEVDSIDGLRLRVMLKDLSAGSLAVVLRQFAQGGG
jgi:hypothetical protein